jgi:hypothetical protein
LRAAGGRGHRIILATISAQKSATYTAITVVVIRQQADEKNAVPQPNRRGEVRRSEERSRRVGIGFETLRERRARAWGRGAARRGSTGGERSGAPK